MQYNDKEAAHTGSRAAAEQRSNGRQLPAVAWPYIKQAPTSTAPLQRQPVIQRVNEEKLSVFPEHGADPRDVQKVSDALVTIRAAFKDKKALFETGTLATMPNTSGLTGPPAKAEKDARVKTVMTDYPALLKSFDPIAELRKIPPFSNGELVLGEKDEHGDRVVKNGSNQVVATLMSDQGSYLPDLVGPDHPEDLRTKYSRFDKPEKEYVEDNVGVPTRRYAYVEKSFYQFMEFLSIGSMTGRWQMLSQAAGIPKNLMDPSDGQDVIEQIRGKKGDPLSVQELAVLHNWKGSGLHQRGLSLSASPREKAVYSNDGESFSSADGVRLKIDLAKVPKQVMLINHYTPLNNPAHLAGIDDNVSGKAFKTVPPPNTAKYNYEGSVVKNRELFLEYLNPDWIVEVKVHGNPASLKPEQFGGDASAMHAQAGVLMGHGDYKSGFTKGVQDHLAGNENQKPVDATSSEGKGWASGQHYSKWFDKGVAYKNREAHWNAGVQYGLENFGTLFTAGKNLAQITININALPAHANYKLGAIAFIERVIKLSFGGVAADKDLKVPGKQKALQAAASVEMPLGYAGLAKEESDAKVLAFDIQRLGWVHGYSGSARKTAVGADFYQKT
ncbi:hypothetical protein SAMN04488505_1104 [Chitinophaga rupis]|uniref:Uncharacterized protein n=1 Tax=Chitinophaga rupis TaxID=573321 RepID=A0A1H8G259_9BACT|nr:hypothetical protein [Chitinophaga rupis]SEN37854.1 hypothetical protein SAMN04488505_1104 [Chitinophaga rupis]